MNAGVALAGFIVGTITGISGIGGSSLLAPVLILVLGVPPAFAIGTDVVYSVPTKLLAAFVHARQKTVDARIVAWLAIGGVPGAIAGLAVFAALRAHTAPAALQHLMRHAIAVAILAAVLAIAVTYVLRRRPTATNEATVLLDRRPARPIAIGFVVGVLVAVTSIGSGSITLPLMLLAMRAVSVRVLIGSEIVFAAMILPIAAVGHVTFGDVDWRVTGSLIAGSLPGVYLGSRLCTQIDERPLRAGVMLVLAYAAYRLL